MTTFSDTPNAEPAPEAPQRPRTAQVLLGVFICWQLWFLLSQNLFGLIEDAQENIEAPIKDAVERVAPGFTKEEGHVLDLAKSVSQINKPWMHVTGQLQNWALFSGSYNDCVFPSLIFFWDETDPLSIPWTKEGEQMSLHAPSFAASNPLEALAASTSQLVQGEDFPKPYQLWLTPHEPANITSYFRWWQMRMRRFETNAVCTLYPDDRPDPDERAEFYERRITKHLNNRGYLTTAYIKFRVAELKHLGREPAKQVLLVQRRYRTVEPEDGPPYLKGPFVTPLLLWQPPVEPGEKGFFRRYHPPTASFRSWE